MRNEWNKIAPQAIVCAWLPCVHIAGRGVESEAIDLQEYQALGGETGEQHTVLSGKKYTEGHGSASEDAAFTQRKRRVQSPGGPPNPVLSPLATAKFWARVSIPSDFQCWEWRGQSNGSGYGRTHGTMAHRIAYQLIHGPILDDVQVRHRCDNPKCCNPSHLLLGNSQDNMDDAVRRKRTARGRGHGNTRLSEKDAAYIKANPDKLTLSQLSERFGVGRSTCSYIRSGRSWKYLDPSSPSSRRGVA